MTLSNILHHFPEGKDRRQALLSYLNNNPDAKIYINRKYCRQLRLDSDLKKLVKSGVLKRHREGTRTCRHSFLTIS